MDDKAQQKERLEQELRFLKESFEAEVISKEEFEKGKERIEKKLKEIEKSATQKIEKLAKEEQKIEIQEKQKTEEITKQPKIETQEQEKVQETKSDEAIETKEEEKIKLKVIQDEAEHEHFEPVRIKVDAAKKIEETVPEESKTEIREEKKENKLFKYVIIFVVLLLVVFFSYYLWKGSLLKPQEKSQKVAEIELETLKINVIVLNDKKNCFNCDTQRVLSILESWFVALDVKEIDYNTNEGKAIAEKFDAKLLPIYILEENITKKPNFEQFKRVFIKKDNNYILSEDVAASTFYFKRDNVPNKLDLFVISGDSASIKAENNLKEFLDTFKDIKFEKHLSTDKLTQELNIKTFPTFLINNRVKFSGIHAAETVKENFCKLNKLKECEKGLSKNLI